MNITIEPSTLSPAYIQIKEQLKAYIKKQRLSPNTKLPDVKAIAENAGVSIRTADLGLMELVKEGICFRRPKKGTFVADSNQNYTKKKICGFIYGREKQQIEENLISLEMQRGLMNTAEKYKIDPISFSTDNIEENIEFYRKNETLLFEGIILATSSVKLKKTVELAKKYPDLYFIILNYFTPEFLTTPTNVIGVFNDDFGGAYQIMDHVLKKGNKNIGLFTIPIEDDNYENRIKGFQAAIKNSSSKTKMKVLTGNPTGSEIQQQEQGRNLSKKLLSSDPDIDTVMCVNDELAKGALSYFREKGRNDVSVCGYDNLIPQSGEKDFFPTMEIDFEGMGKTAIDIIANRKNEYPKIIKIPPLLISNT